MNCIVLLSQLFRHNYIQPTYISLKRQPNMLQEGEQRWVSLTRLRDSDEAIGLSAAALRLLKEH